MNKMFFEPRDVQLQSFAELCGQCTEPADFPHSVDVVENSVVYSGESLRKVRPDGAESIAIKSELAYCLKDGPGVFVVRGAYEDLSVIDRSTQVYREIVSREQASGPVRGDHFGNNERIWNSLQKACVADPDLFIDYYGNPILRLVSEAWLGPNYRITAQINNVKSGGEAQSAHRDYHLGFQTQSAVSRYPAHSQIMSQYLTLQGAIAHCDMSIEKGPTLLLPYSQQFGPGFWAYHEAEFANFFARNCVQVPLLKGDLLFFNPALFHAGGSNSTDSDRVANLVQVSSAFGRTMESVNNRVMIEAVYPHLLARKMAGTSSEALIRDTLAAVADGYSFPTNLDSDPPIDGRAPATQQEIVWQSLMKEWPLETLVAALLSHEKRRRA